MLNVIDVGFYGNILYFSTKSRLRSICKMRCKKSREDSRTILNQAAHEKTSGKPYKDISSIAQTKICGENCS